MDVGVGNDFIGLSATTSSVELNYLKRDTCLWKFKTEEINNEIKYCFMNLENNVYLAVNAENNALTVTTKIQEAANLNFEIANNNNNNKVYIWTELNGERVYLYYISKSVGSAVKWMPFDNEKDKIHNLIRLIRTRE